MHAVMAKEWARLINKIVCGRADGIIRTYLHAKNNERYLESPDRLLGIFCKRRCIALNRDCWLKRQIYSPAHQWGCISSCDITRVALCKLSSAPLLPAQACSHYQIISTRGETYGAIMHRR